MIRSTLLSIILGTVVVLINCFTDVQVYRSVMLQADRYLVSESQYVASLFPKTSDTAIDPVSIQARTTSPLPRIPANSPYAYAFVIGGCNPDNPGYRGFVYNIIVSAQIFQSVASKADIVVFFQMSNDATTNELPQEDVRLLEALNVRILYIPKSPTESFYETVMNKFRVLSLIEYRRVILMDGDVMPLQNLDYLFEMSDGENATLEENLVVAGPFEPANAGFFMLTPGEGEYEKVLDIIQTREHKAASLRGKKFDLVEGWGHMIEAPDEWVSRKAHGQLWDFHFAFSDQGLLYYWTKYVKKSVSIVFHYHVENWSPGEDGKVRLEKKHDNLFHSQMDTSNLLTYAFVACRKFMCGFKHATGYNKPWLRQPPADLSDETRLLTPDHLWWSTLMDLDTKLTMDIDFHNFTVARPSHGLFTTHRDMNRHVRQSNNASLASLASL